MLAGKLKIIKEVNRKQWKDTEFQTQHCQHA